VSWDQSVTHVPGPYINHSLQLRAAADFDHAGVALTSASAGFSL
jgi:hypothetical protein